MQQPDYILEMRGITKLFPGVRALSDVDFKVARGHIHALVGENGAGKSTLIKIISGVYPYGSYDGQMFYDGKEMKFQSIRDVEKEGIACIHQELNVVPELSVSENIFLNEKPTRFGFIDFDKMYVDSMKLLKQIGLNTEGNLTISPDEKVRNLGIGQKQMVEIAKALAKEVRLLILDEPTAALTEAEVDVLLDIVCKLRSEGVTCIYISHRLDEVMRIADEITVLRDGQTIETRKRTNLDKETMISLMVGRELTNMFPRVPHTRDELVLEIRNYCVNHPDVAGKKLIENVSLQAYRGEILGISGLMGAGRTELFTALFGAYREKGQGEILINGKPVQISSPMDALKHGFFLISEDRKKLGLNLIMSIKENTTLAALRKVSKYGVLNDDKEVNYTNQYKNNLQIATPDINSAVSCLSGGNQQKVVIAKALVCEPKIIVLDEPTRGIDVGAKYEIYKLMNLLVDQGVVVIMISSEMEEIMGMSDRIITMANGKITGEFDISEATQEILLQASVPGR
ncbi:sugar ABC transporter ATP-binding protein [Sinanaerobacter chloroacetimidivorans]|nr:ATP-binding cassette domain-containing protein [Sinanaerobacter chloroacetimidivorans]